MDPKYSMWLSTDLALSDYMAGSSAGCGEIYNHINLNLYHYATNNSVKYTDHAVGNFLIALNFELIQDKKSDEWFSFSGVLIHEVSHNFFVLNTEDIKYMAFESRALSNKVKVANATNWEYFYNQSTKLLREKEND